MYKASINITLRPSILDPQGKAAHHALESLGFDKVESIRMGKFVEMWINEDTEEEAVLVARGACSKLLANPVMEDFTILVERANE